MSDQPPKPDPLASRNPEHHRSFATLLAALEQGRFVDSLSESLRDVVAAMHEASTGANKTKGQITITLDLELDDGVVEVRANSKTKQPKPPRGRTVFWVTPENNLTGANPRQAELPLRTIDAYQQPSIRSGF